MKTTITIRNVPFEHKEYIDELATSLETNLGGAFTHLVNIAKTAKTDDDIKAITDESTKKIAVLDETISQKDAEILTLRSEIETLKAREPEVVEKTVEKTIEVEKPLTGAQFICDLPEPVAVALRKVRTFAKKDGFVPPESNGEQYANDIAIVAIKQFINRNYFDDVIDKKL